MSDYLIRTQPASVYAIAIHDNTPENRLVVALQAAIRKIEALPLHEPPCYCGHYADEEIHRPGSGHTFRPDDRPISLDATRAILRDVQERMA